MFSVPGRINNCRGTDESETTAVLIDGDTDSFVNRPICRGHVDTPILLYYFWRGRAITRLDVASFIVFLCPLHLRPFERGVENT